MLFRPSAASGEIAVFEYSVTAISSLRFAAVETTWVLNKHQFIAWFNKADRLNIYDKFSGKGSGVLAFRGQGLGSGLSIAEGCTQPDARRRECITSSVMKSHIKRRIHIIHVSLVQLFPQQLNGFTEPLEMDNLPFPQKFDHVIDIRIITDSQNIVIGNSCLLFCCQIFRQVGDGVALYRHGFCGPGGTCCGGRVNSDGPVDKIGREGRIFDLVLF